ncbi:hypothetical protein [Ruegeria sp.]|uniref:hypothetical protein n=1 Tax=Ruegeria sp. TaxID=1879320 RepID=UPI003B00BD29
MILRLSSVPAPGLAALLVSTLALGESLSPMAASAQTAPPGGTLGGTPGGTLGIDCDQPRRSVAGRLILDRDGAHRIACEADRATALNYARVVRETRNRLRLALDAAPQPLWDDLVTHLRNDGAGTERQGSGDRVSDWSYTTRDIDALPAGSAARRAADYWKDGVLNRSAVPKDWRPIVKTRACGVEMEGDRPVPGIGAAVFVWLDRDRIRERWSSQMVQRTVRAWLERGQSRVSMIEEIPDILTGARTLKDANGQERVLSADLRACIDQDPAIPEGALVMRASLTWKSKRGETLRPCTDPLRVGVQRLGWERHNGLYIVPLQAIRADGSPHPQRGRPLLAQFADPRDRPVLVDETVSIDYPIVEGEEDNEAANQAEATFLVRNSCRVPRVRDVIRAEDCKAIINGTEVEGKHIRVFRFREVQDDPADPTRVYLRPVMRDPRNAANGLGVVVAGNGHPMWEESTIGCGDHVPATELPDIPDPVVDTVPATSCKQHWGKSYEGARTGYVQTITYPAGWSLDDVVIRTVRDDCFNTIPVQKTQTTPAGTCPRGQIGSITKSRRLTWFNRAWAVQDRVYPRFARRLPDRASLEHAIAQLRTDQTGLAWYDQVRAESWSTSNTCRRPPPKPSSGGGDGGRGEGGSGGGAYDTTGDGRTDSYSPNDDGSHYGRAHDTGMDAHGPGSPGRGSQSGRDG